MKHAKWIMIPLNVDFCELTAKGYEYKHDMRIKCSHCGFVTSLELREEYIHCPVCKASMDK